MPRDPNQLTLSLWRVFPFYFVVGAFIADSVVNFFARIPLFVAAMPVGLLLVLLTVPSSRAQTMLASAIALAVASFAFVAIRYGFQVDNFTDLIFFIFYFGCFYYARYVPVSENRISICTLFLMAMFLPTFVGINSGDYMSAADAFSAKADIEFIRVYHPGLYRLPHLAAYMLALSSFWWLFLGMKYKRPSFYFVSALAFASMLYAGVRTPLVGVVLAFVLTKIRARPASAAALIMTAVGIVFMLVFIDDLLQLTFGTPFYQYLTFIKTAVSNSDRLSRVLIWTNWGRAMTEFGVVDYMFGRGMAEAIQYNLLYLGIPIWFHNDFLSFIFCYGIFPSLFVIFLVTKTLIDSYTAKSQFAVFLTYYIILSAIFNGFYKYVPVIGLVMVYAVCRQPNLNRMSLRQKAGHAPRTARRYAAHA